MEPSFETALRAAFEAFGADLAAELWMFITWLEENGQAYRYRTSGEPFLAAIPAANINALTSHLVFEMPPDLLRYWLGKEGYESQIIPFMKCGGDGSYIALWRQADAADMFVFLGSEGESFVIAENAIDLIALISLGYESIEGRDVLAATPKTIWSEWNETPWVEPVALKSWVSETFGINHKAKGAAYLPFDEGADPFETFVAKVTQ